MLIRILKTCTLKRNNIEREERPEEKKKSGKSH
jgi:hypothetical protein